MAASKKKNDGQNPQITIGGSVYTSGGDIAAGKIVKGSVYQNVTFSHEISTLFEPIYNKIDQLTDLSSEQKEKIREEVQALQQEVVKDKRNIRFIETRIKNLISMAPDIRELILALIQNPALGLEVLVEKIAKKARSETSEKQKKSYRKSKNSQV